MNTEPSIREKLDTWRNEDHEDWLMLSRNEVCVLLDLLAEIENEALERDLNEEV